MSTDNKLISVIIPSYNHAKYIGFVIESIITQTYQNLELIIIDDFSKDNTSEIVEKYRHKCEERFMDFKFVQKIQNTGIVDSLNIAIDLTKGEFIYFIASDDIAAPESINILYDFIKNEEAYGIVVGNNDFIDENNNRIFWDEKQNTVYEESKACYKTFAEYLRKNRPDVDFESENFGSYETLLKGNYIPNGYIIRKQAVLNIGKYKEGLLEDWYMNLQIAKNYKFKFLDKILYSYRWHDSNTIKDRKAAKLIFKKTFLEEKEYCYGNEHQRLWEYLHKQLFKGRLCKIHMELSRFFKKIAFLVGKATCK